MSEPIVRKIALMASQDWSLRAAMAAKAAEILLKGQLAEVNEENLPVKRVKIEEAVLNDFLGRYETFSPRFTVKINKGTNDLMMEVSGPPAFPIVPESTNQFATMDGRARMRFERGVNGKVAKLTVVQGRDVFAHWKVATDRQVVSGYEGSYLSDEIGARSGSRRRRGINFPKASFSQLSTACPRRDQSISNEAPPQTDEACG
jgi:hypothetical protein